MSSFLRYRFAFGLACSMLAGCSATPETMASADTAAPVMASYVDKGDKRTLADFKKEIRTAALKAGVSEVTIRQSLANFQPIARVVELDRKQPEKTQSFAQYLDHTVTDARIQKGQAMLDANRALLGRIEHDYGVPSSILVSLWGMESSYGSVMGDYGTIPSLATLAYEGRRHDLFKGELVKAMEIVDAGDISYHDMTGSWAGAMGQVQFMPSTFLNYAVDYTHTGHRDIWHNNADALASAANYLSQLGWKPGELWGREVSVPPGVGTPLVGWDKARPLADWKRLGVTKVDGGPLPDGNDESALIMPDGAGGRAFLAYDNFKIIMKWNHSTYFATAVGLISDAIDGRE